MGVKCRVEECRECEEETMMMMKREEMTSPLLTALEGEGREGERVCVQREEWPGRGRWSQGVQFGHQAHPDTLVQGPKHTQAGSIGGPVKAGDGLGGEVVAG